MAYQNFFDNLTNTVHRDTVANPIVEAYIRPFRKSLNQFPWAVTPSLLTHINRLGISATSFGTLPHPHPFHKIIETHLLENHWSFLARHSSTVMYMKPSKFEKLQEINHHFAFLMNYRHTPKDITRYPESKPFYPKTQSAFMHDALMYFTPGQIYDLFLKSPVLDNLYCSLVVPAETKYRLPSLYPAIYNLIYNGTNLTYTLEGNSSGEYEQPISAVDWLSTSVIKGPDFDLTVVLLESWYSIHSLLITRTSKPAQTIRTFNTPPAIKLPGPTVQLPLSSLLVPVEVYKQLFNYVRAVRTLRQTDPAGFVRTQASKPEYSWVSSSAWDELSNFALATANQRPSRDYKPYHSRWDSIKETLNNWFLRQSPKFKILVSLSTILVTHCTTIGFRVSKYVFGPMTYRFVAFSELQPPIKNLPPFLLALVPKFVLRRYTTQSILQLPPRHFFEFHFHRPLFDYGLKNPTRSTVLVGGSLFALYSLIKWLLAPPTELQLSDQYLSFFHPQPWILSFQTRPIVVQPISFFPIGASISSAPDSTYSSAHSESNSDDPNSTDSSSSETIEEVTEQEPLSTAREDNTSSPTPSPEPFNEPSADVPQTSGNALTASPNESTAPTDPEPPRPLLRNNELVVGESAPCREPRPDNPNPLAIDPTACGPIGSFRSLHGYNMPAGQGEFLTRRRASPAIPSYPEADCLLVSLEQCIGIGRHQLWNTLCTTFPDSQLVSENERRGGLTTDHLTALAWAHNFRTNVQSQYGAFVIGPESNLHGTITHTNGSPGHWSTEPLPLRGAFTKSSPFQMPALDFKDKEGNQLAFRFVHWYSPSRGRAKNLSSNMKNEFDGILSALFKANPNFDPQFFHRLDARTDFAFNRSVQMIHISGFPGCGKSYPVSQLLATKPFAGNFRVAVPTTTLRDEWKHMLNLRSTEKWRVGTWESSLTKSSRVLVIDEIYKLPNGYIDLCLIADPSIEFVIALGDPTQASYKSTHPESTNHLITSEVDHLSPYRDFYCFWTHRLPICIAEKFGVRTTNTYRGSISHHSNVNPRLQMMVASIPSANIFNGNCIRTTTFAAAQGVTHNGHSQIFVDKNVQALHPSVAFVALTRSRRGLIFTGHHQMLKIRGSCPLFEAFYFKERVDFSTVFAKELTGAMFIREPIKNRDLIPLRGASVRAWSNLDKRYHRMTNFKFDPAHVRAPRTPSSKPLKSDYKDDIILEAEPVNDLGDPVVPHISTHFVPETRRPLHQDLPTALHSPVTITQPHQTVDSIEPVYPGFDYELLMQNLVPTHDPSDREIYFKGERSNQFPWMDNDFELGSQPPTLIAPIHDIKNDPHLLLASIEKRLRFRPSDRPYQISPSDEATGHMLYHSLCRAYHRKPTDAIPFNPVLFSECININEYHQLSSKTQAVIMANAARSDPDWRWTAVRIFSKTQHKVNEGSFFGNWKACQTLALMHDAIVLLFGPIKKYQRLFDEKDRPSNLFVYGGHTPFELSKHCQEHLTPDTETVCNDYTAFDQSQTGEAVVLERLKMKRLNIPDHLIEKHIEIKTNIVSQFGPLTCMRLTGEPGTYDDNTDYNIAVIYTEYNIKKETVYVSGDDSTISPVPRTRPHWNKAKNNLKVTFKKEFTNYPLFCGYYLGSVGAVRAPRPLFCKLAIAIADKTLSDKLASYLAEFVVGHSLGDALWNVLPLEQVEYQSACFDFFCRNCSKEQKLSMKIGEVPEETITSLLSTGVKWLARPLFAFLSRHSRFQLLYHSPHAARNFADDPDLKGVLLP
nr:MAG: replication polyprotein [Myotis brandtii tymo-like virus 1]